MQGEKLDFFVSKAQALSWASKFDQYTFLDSNDYVHGFGLEQFDWMLGVSKNENCDAFNHNPQDILSSKQDELFFFHFNYDLKNVLEPCLNSNNPSVIDVNQVYIQNPEVILYSKDNQIYYINVLGQFSQEDRFDLLNGKLSKKEYHINIRANWAKKDYSKAFNQCMEYLEQGHIYEMNLCQEYSIEKFNVEPEQFFIDLNNQAKSPFASCMKVNNYYIFSASPERFIYNKDKHLVSQPIKGTRPRKWTKEEDNAQKKALLNSIKETSENKMIVDLVRNDLSLFAKKGSVRVDELCKIYSFPNVHQMISSVSCELENHSKIWNAILGAFPMGSMTGVPKMRCMEIIDELESFSRGSYSGTIGFSMPGFIDSNVLIRSVFYNKSEDIARCVIGGAITIRSNMDEEFEECQVKINGIVKVLGGTLIQN